MEACRGTEFGVALSTPDSPAGFAALAEAYGFDFLACGEHLAFTGPTANAFVSLSVAAGATTSIKLLSAVTLLPLYPPVLAAKLASALDVASRGRFHLGVGVGGEFPAEFRAVGVPPEQRGARTDEALALIDRLMTRERVNFRGPFTEITDVTIAPRPVQRPRVPFWIAGRTPAAMRRAARVGQAWMPYLYTPQMVAESLVRVRAFAEHEARPWTGRTAVHLFTTVGPDGAAARREAAERVGRNYRQDFTGTRRRYLVAGTPGECADRVREYVDAGVDVVLFRLTCAQRESETMLRRLAEEVVPALR